MHLKEINLILFNFNIFIDYEYKNATNENL